MDDFCEAGQGLGLIPVKHLLFVHVEDVELVLGRGEAPLRVGLAPDLEVEPVAVALRVRVRSQVQVELSRLHLKGQVEIAGFELRIEEEVALCVLLPRLVQQTFTDWGTGCLPMHTALKGLCLDVLRNEHIVELRLFIQSNFLAEAQMQF